MAEPEPGPPDSKLFQPGSADTDQARIVIGLNAVIIAIADETPLVLSVRPPEDHGARFGAAYGLPYGPFEPNRHRTFEIGLRSWVEEQTYLKLGYVEQLYTFGDRGRDAPIAALGRKGEGDARVVSVGYLAITPKIQAVDAPGAAWRDWRHYFPWEDWRSGPPPMITERIAPRLGTWAKAAETPAESRTRRARAAQCFGLEGRSWDEEKVLDRYELLYEAGLAVEAWRDRRAIDAKPHREERILADAFGEPMISDHRRILATAIGRLRGKLKYRPIIFELMPERFTLLDLQRAVEALSGYCLHKQNFRRAVERSGLVVATGEMSTETGGRPAALFRFRRELKRDQAVRGLPISRPRSLQSPS